MIRGHASGASNRSGTPVTRRSRGHTGERLMDMDGPRSRSAHPPMDCPPPNPTSKSEKHTRGFHRLPGLSFLLALALWPAGLFGCSDAARGPRVGREGQPAVRLAADIERTGWVGVIVQTDSMSGALGIVEVIDPSPAAEAGLQPGDVITAIDSMPTAGASDAAIARVRATWAPGRTVTYSIRRGAFDRRVLLRLAPMPSEIISSTFERSGTRPQTVGGGGGGR